MGTEVPTANTVGRFATAVYGEAGVAEACLGLQERHGLDVNLLLFAGCAGAVHRRTLAATDVRAVRARVADWHLEVVRALRTVRQRLKSGPPPAPSVVTARLRQRLQQLEIDAELIELGELGRDIATIGELSPIADPAERARAAMTTVVAEYCHPGTVDLEAIATVAVAAAAHTVGR